MTRFFAFAGVAALAVMASTAARSDDDKPAPTVSPKAGEYTCYMLAMGGTVSTAYGAAPTLTTTPSGLVRVQVDGKNTYRHSSGSGRYQYQPDTGRIVFESGPLKGWAARSELDGDTRVLRFAPKKEARLEPTTRLGDHLCSLTSE